MNEVKELIEELRNKKSRDNRDLLDRSADMIEKLAKELCDKSGQVKSATTSRPLRNSGSSAVT